MDTDLAPHPTQSATSRKAVQDALEASKKLQQILTRRAEHLEERSKTIDTLLEDADVDEGEDEPGPEVLIPGAKRAAGLFPLRELLNPSSPFYDEATKRTLYTFNTKPRPMKAKEMEVLAAAVRQENERLRAYKKTQQDSSADLIDLDRNVEGLDWIRIAEKVSDSSPVKRTPTECRVIWIGSQHPGINHSEWQKAEVDQLNAIVQSSSENRKQIDWVKVAQLLGTSRTPIDCMRHGLQQQRHNWTSEADQKLIDAVQTYGIDNWQLVARNVSEYVTPSQCQGRWQKSLNPAIKRYAWTADEDDRLRKAVAGYGNSWVQVATAVPGRTNDQCRERWTEHLRPSTSTAAWTESEDKQLVELVQRLGNKWSTISSMLGNNKTGQNCRLRYERLKKKTESQALGPRIIQSHNSPQIVGPSETSQMPNAAPMVLVPPSQPASMILQSESSFGGPSSSRSSTVVSNHQTTEAIEAVTTKPRPKPRPKRSKKAEGTEQSSVADTTQLASGDPSAARVTTPQSIISQTASTEGGEAPGNDIQANSAAVTPTVSTPHLALQAHEQDGTRKGAVGSGSETSQELALDQSTVSNTLLTPSSKNQEAVGIESFRTPKKRGRPKGAPSATQDTSVSEEMGSAHDTRATPDHVAEEDVLPTGGSHKRKMSSTNIVEEQTGQGRPKKVKESRSRAENSKKQSTAQVVPAEPSYDVSKLRRGRSRKHMPSTSAVQNSEPAIDPPAAAAGDVSSGS